MNTAAHALPLIGITMGDPVGIGPEVVIKALSCEDVYRCCRPFVLGDTAVLEKEKKALHSPLAIHVIEDPRQAAFTCGTLDIFSLSRLIPDTLRYGHPDQETGTAMGTYIVRAAAMALCREIDAMVTGPINKKSLQEGGYPYPGHTEMLARLTDTQDVVMMLAGEKLRVVLVTIHCAVSQVPRLLSREKILSTVLITAEGLKNYFSLPAPRIAVASLNPHAGEEGMFGGEETETILPAIMQAQHRGVNVSGPYPADTLFYYAAQGRYDAVVCMYHDQGLIPLKLLHFEDGVNITLGLPIIRTSVDHGTAYDIAGKGIANPSSLIQAITIASRMAAARQGQSPWKKPGVTI
jgi:4-hydroxythreonine-4-phosphate dehydrogenase